MKKFKFALLALMLAMIVVIPLNLNKANATPNVTVKIDGVQVSFPDQKPYIDTANRTMVPVRAPMEQMGCTVEWNADKNQATITKESTKAVFTINSKTYTINGASKTMDTQAVITNNRTSFPIRFAAEAMGATVSWDQATYTVLISTTGEVVVPEQPVPPVQTSEKIGSTPFYQATTEQIQACKNAPMPSYTKKDFNQTSQEGKDASYELWSYRFDKVPYKFITDKSLVYMGSGSFFRGYMDMNDGKGLRIVDLTFGDKNCAIVNANTHERIEFLEW